MIKLLATAALALTIVAPAAAASYTTSAATYTGIGDTIGSTFDQIALGSVSGTATAPGTYLVNTVVFTVGVNATTGATSSGSFTNTATIDGSPFSYTVPYTITIGGTDSITLGGNSFTVDGVRVKFNALTFSNIGSTASGDLTATVSVPEPASWALMVAGFGLVGFAARRRRIGAVAA